MAKQKRIIIDNGTVKRVTRAGFQQDTRGKCLICSGDFRECPHDYRTVMEVIEIVSRSQKFDVRINVV